MKVSINTVEKVKDFVNEMSKLPCDVDIVSGRHIIDAKSIMGVLSLDVSKPIEIAVHPHDEAEEKRAKEALAPFAVQ